MPYNRHQDFRTYFRDAKLATLRSYFYCLFSGLAATHRQQIIHRDVKPANFLYDIYTGHGVLCDYGLAECAGQEMCTIWTGSCLHSLPGPSWGGLAGREKSTKKVAVLEPHEAPGLSSGLHGVRLQKPLRTYDQLVEMERQWRALKNAVVNNPDSKYDARRRVAKLKPYVLREEHKLWLLEQTSKRDHFFNSWRPPIRNGQTNRALEEQVGYLKEDKRPSVRANRAGTRGFRAPEVLFKCPDQTVALDVWSAGIILLCFLTRRFPFFNSNDDTEALLELLAIYGRRKMERVAALHSKALSLRIYEIAGLAHSFDEQIARCSQTSRRSKHRLTPTFTRSSNRSIQPSLSKTLPIHRARFRRRTNRTKNGTQTRRSITRSTC